MESDEDLDHFLVEQLHQAKANLKLAKRMLSLMPTDMQIIKGIEIIEQRITFYENHIQIGRAHV